MKRPVRSVAIRHPQDPGRPTMIREDRYDPERHVLWGDADEQGPAHATQTAGDSVLAELHEPGDGEGS